MKIETLDTSEHASLTSSWPKVESQPSVPSLDYPRQVPQVASPKRMAPIELLHRSLIDKTQSIAALRSVLKSTINNNIRQRPGAAWLLPDKATLADVVDLGEEWVELVKALVLCTEIMNGCMRPTFPLLGNAEESLRHAVETVKSKADPVVLLIYDPTLSNGDRQRMWETEVTNFISFPELAKHTNALNVDPNTMDHEYWQELLEKFTNILRTNAKLFATCYASALENNHTVARLDALVEAFFPSTPQGAGYNNFTIPKPKWSVASCIAEMQRQHMLTDAEKRNGVARTLGIWQNKNFFSPDAVPALMSALVESGATSTEAMVIVDDIKINVFKK